LFRPMDMAGFNLVNTLLFPTPESSYGIADFPEELIWVPKNLEPHNTSPEDCIPCLLLSSPSARFFVLYLHSNAEDLGRCYTFCSMLRYQFQVHVLAVEYPGYGICPGEQATEETVIENASVAFRFLREVMKWPLDGIIVFGRSIGCGPALALAADHAVYGVILVCPFLSVRELCRGFIGMLADLIDERFPNKDRVGFLTSPLLLVHGKKDTVVPWTHGRTLFEACRSRKRFVSPENMHHNTNLHSDASFFVLPMLQFFSLPDYDFNDFRVPQWVFDKRMSPCYDENSYAVASVAGCPQKGQEGAKTEPIVPSNSSLLQSTHDGQPITVRTPTASTGPAATAVAAAAAAEAAVALPWRPMGERATTGLQLQEPAWEKFNSFADPAGTTPTSSVKSPVAACSAAARCAELAKLGDDDVPVQSEGSTVSSEDPGLRSEASEAKVKDVAAAAVHRFLELNHLNDISHWPARQSNAVDTMEADEPPEPPEDRGFIKVPRTRHGGPDMIASLPLKQAHKAQQVDCGAFNWLTPRLTPRKSPRERKSLVPI